MKIDLALNNLQRLICHKPKQTNIAYLFAHSLMVSTIATYH